MWSVTNSVANLESRASEIRRCWSRSRLAGQVSRSELLHTDGNCCAAFSVACICTVDVPRSDTMDVLKHGQPTQCDRRDAFRQRRLAFCFRAIQCTRVHCAQYSLYACSGRHSATLCRLYVPRLKVRAAPPAGEAAAPPAGAAAAPPVVSGRAGAAEARFFAPVTLAPTCLPHESPPVGVVVRARRAHTLSTRGVVARACTGVRVLASARAGGGARALVLEAATTGLGRDAADGPPGAAARTGCTGGEKA